MTTLKRIIFVSLILIFLSPYVKAQQDSVVLDSIVTSLRVLIDEYNKEVHVIDTSSFVTEGYDTQNINLQIASSMGACHEIITLFAEGADVNNFVGSVATPLHYAVSSGSIKAVEIPLLSVFDIEALYRIRSSAISRLSAITAAIPPWA